MNTLPITLPLLLLGLLSPLGNSAFADIARGKQLFGERCVMCHGAEGAGDGPVAQALPPESKPRNLQQAQFKFATDDEKLAKLIRAGGAAVGLNPLMPAQDKLSDDELSGLIAFVHSLKK